MVTNKYANDYRLENILGKNGKLVTVAVYRGLYFRFTAPQDTIRRMKIIYPAAFAVSMAAWLALMCVNLRGVAWSWSVLVPMAIGVIAMLFEGCAVWRLCTAGEKVTREHNDKLYTRMASSSACHMVLGGIGLIGSVIVLCINSFRWTYVLALLATAVFEAGGIVMFRFRKNLVMDVIAQNSTED